MSADDVIETAEDKGEKVMVGMTRLLGFLILCGATFLVLNITLNREHRIHESVRLWEALLTLVVGLIMTGNRETAKKLIKVLKKAR